jgi:hypothetical protein
MLSFETSSPKTLLANIKSAIDKGTVATWSYDSDGDFIHTPPQWAHQAWLRPVVVGSELRFTILCPVGTTMNKEVYGVYHGRFIEMMLVHFDLNFQNAVSTALASVEDVVVAA